MADGADLSRRLSYWLRHRPDAAGLTLDDAGWGEAQAVLQALAAAGFSGGRARLEAIVRDSDKQRFQWSPSGDKIRARQGHSVKVELGWPAADPPEWLYHGTVERALGAIHSEGLKPMKRHHVHLSPDAEAAAKVGARRGPPVVLRIRAAALAAAGHRFLLTGNGVWLTRCVPPDFLDECDRGGRGSSRAS